LATEIERLTILLKNYTESELYEKAAIIKNKLDKVFKKYKEL
jgi:protein-arginine kinase activator protein McsA